MTFQTMKTLSTKKSWYFLLKDQLVELVELVSPLLRTDFHRRSSLKCETQSLP
jgi:hypothetical protein